MSRPEYAIFRRLKWAVLLAVCVSGGAGCGLRLSGFFTPLYSAPSGYSESYRAHLDATDRRPVRRELVDPTLSTIHDWMQPVPLSATGSASGTDNPAARPGEYRGLMPDGAMPEIPDIIPEPGGSRIRSSPTPELFPGTPPGTVVPTIPRGQGSGTVPPAPGF